MESLRRLLKAKNELRTEADELDRRARNVPGQFGLAGAISKLRN